MDEGDRSYKTSLRRLKELELFSRQMIGILAVVLLPLPQSHSRLGLSQSLESRLNYTSNSFRSSHHHFSNKYQTRLEHSRWRLRGGSTFVSFASRYFYDRLNKGKLRTPSEESSEKLEDWIAESKRGKQKLDDVEKQQMKRGLGDAVGQSSDEDESSEHACGGWEEEEEEDEEGGGLEKFGGMSKEMMEAPARVRSMLDDDEREIPDSLIPDLPEDANQTRAEEMAYQAMLREVERELQHTTIEPGDLYETVTFAGSEKFRSRDGVSSRARFREPFDLAFSGRTKMLYVAEARGHKIRKVYPDGVVATHAGRGYEGFADGEALKIGFATPFGVTVDEEEDNLYVTDTFNQRVRRVTNDGFVFTIAGDLPIGDRKGFDGPPMEAIFSYPTGIELDAGLNLYIADTSHGMIRKIDATTGKVSTLVGDGFGDPVDGPMTSAKLGNPRGLALDHIKGRLLFTDYSDEAWVRIRELDADGHVNTIAGQAGHGYQDGPASEARFGSPHGIAVDSRGNIYLADPQNHAIRLIDPSLQVTTIAGSGSGGICDGLGRSARFYGPYGIAVNEEEGVIYVADTLNNRVRKVMRISEDRARAILRAQMVEDRENRAAEKKMEDFIASAREREKAKREREQKEMDAEEQEAAALLNEEIDLEDDDGDEEEVADGEALRQGDDARNDDDNTDDGEQNGYLGL